MSLFVARRLGAVAIVAFAVGACSPQSSVAAAQAESAGRSRGRSRAQVPSSPQPVGTLNGRVLPDFATLVEQVGPAVVNVSVVEKAHRVATGSLPRDADDPVQEFFRRFGMPNGPQGRGFESQPRQGEGSGFIVSADGYILTNAHVVADADEVTVRMTDRREYTAKVVGLDRRTDVAVLKIEGKNLPVVRIGDPSKLRPGEWVLAIGSPFTFENSVTAGIVSATGRSMPGEDLVPFIQTDVAVNPGNSGGPLFNLNGEVVGINSQIYSRSGGYMGLSFAIPIDVANNVRQQLVSTGKVTRGRIGVQIQEVNAQFADAFGLDRPRGALVGQVIEDGPAEKARREDRRRHPQRRRQGRGAFRAAAGRHLGHQAGRHRQGRSVARRRRQDAQRQGRGVPGRNPEGREPRRRRAGQGRQARACRCVRSAPTSARAPRPRAIYWSKTSRARPRRPACVPATSSSASMASR